MLWHFCSLLQMSFIYFLHVCFMKFYGKFRELTVQLCVHSSAFYFISERGYSTSPICYKEHLFCALYVTRATVTVLGSLRYWPSSPAVYSKYHVQHISAAIPALIAGMRNADNEEEMWDCRVGDNALGRGTRLGKLETVPETDSRWCESCTLAGFATCGILRYVPYPAKQASHCSHWVT